MAERRSGIHRGLEGAGLDAWSRQSLVGFTQVASKGGRAVAVNLAVEPLDFIECGPHLLPAERGVGEKVDEILYGLLEVDVVLPQRVVAVDDQDGPGRHRCPEHSRFA